MMVNGAFVVRFVLLFGVRSSVAANSVTSDVLSASGSFGQGLPSILDRDAALMAATLCRVKRGLPLPEVGPLVCFQLVSAATLAAAGAAPCWAWETEWFFLLSVFGDAMAATLCCVMRGLPLLEVGPLVCFQIAGLAPCWAVEADRILTKFELGGICSCSACSSGSGIGVPLDCLVSLCIPGGFWIETDSLVFFVDDCSCCFPGERIKITEALSLPVYGYLLSSQVMYGIQEAAAACYLLAFALFLVYFVGWQLQPAACTFAGMLVLNVSEIVASVVEGLFAFGCLDEWEGESLLAGNSPVGTGEQATGRVDVPGEKQMGAAAAAAAAASGCPPPQVQNENVTWQILVTSLSGRSVALQVSLSMDHDCLVDLLADRTGVPAGSFYLLRNGKAWWGEDGLRKGDCVRMAGRLLGGARPPPVFIPGQWTCTSCGMEGCWPSKMRCFRCLAPRPVVNGADSSRPVLGKGNARERSYPGQSSVAQNPTNPTIRYLPNAGAPAPRPVGPVAPTAPPAVDLTDATTITNVLHLLAGLGVSETLLQQIKSSIPPPATGKQKNAGPEKQLQIITGKITVLEQQVVKLEKQKDRLVRELDECHASRADKEAQLEVLRAQYREVRDTGKFTPTRVSPAPSVRATSVAGDEVPSRDVNMEDVGAAVGSSDGAGGEPASGNSELRGSRGSGQAETHVHPDGAPASSRPIHVDSGKRRCVESPGAPTVEAVSSGRWHYSEQDCHELIAVLRSRLEEHREAFEANVAHGDFDANGGLEGGLDSEVSLG